MSRGSQGNFNRCITHPVSNKVMQPCLFQCSSKLKGDFAAVVQLSPEEQQDVYNLWHVDHGFFDDAIAYIAQNPRFNGRDASAVSWSTAVTIMSAFKSADAIADLLKMGCPPLLGK